MDTPADISRAVQRLYNTYPFPPDPLTDGPPPGYNWRWHWSAVHSFCTGVLPPRQDICILDAGCGTGVGTDYLAHLNPETTITALDLSEQALAIAQERTRRSGVPRPVTFHHLSLLEVASLGLTFEYINCVGVLHHLPDPAAGLRALANCLAPGGILHFFVYAAYGRWEIRLLQEAIRLLNPSADPVQGVQAGRQLLAHLPPDNRLVQREKQRWAMENHWDASFADMYVHPQEVDYTVESLFDLIGTTDLAFLGFSNPDHWRLERLLGTDPDLLAAAQGLPLRQRYRLVDVLDPETTHYELFLGRPPLPQFTWDEDADLLAAIPEVYPCLTGWPSPSLLDRDYRPLDLDAPSFRLLSACDGRSTVADVLRQTNTDLALVRQLWQRYLLVLTPAGTSGRPAGV